MGCWREAEACALPWTGQLVSLSLSFLLRERSRARRLASCTVRPPHDIPSRRDTGAPGARDLRGSARVLLLCNADPQSVAQLHAVRGRQRLHIQRPRKYMTYSDVGNSECYGDNESRRPTRLGRGGG
jgi:hypothetical protein